MPSRVFWFLCGNENTPSSRIHGINIHQKLNALGFISEVVFKPHKYTIDISYSPWMLRLLSNAISANDRVIIQKLSGHRSEWFVQLLKKKGVMIGYIDCDLPLKINMASLADYLICPSVELCKQYELSGIKNVHQIEDAVELFLNPVDNKSKIKKTIVWFGKSTKGKWGAVDWFKREVLPEVKDKWNFITISDHKDSTYKWDRGTVSHILNKSDLAIIPVSKQEIDIVKSANRCTQSFALGLPVLAGNIKSYRSVIQDFYNGYVTDNKHGWIDYIRKLENENYLWKAKLNAFNSSKKYSIDEIIKEWILILKPEKHSRSNTDIVVWRVMILLFNLIQNIKRLVAKNLMKKESKFIETE